jgi:phosphatidylglycerophosphate synthase
VWTLRRAITPASVARGDALIMGRFALRPPGVGAGRPPGAPPTLVTMVASGGGRAAGFAARRGGYAMIALAGVMFELNSILDSVDGELARLRFQYSKLGQWLDNLSDEVVDNAFVIGVGWALGGIWLPIALGAAGGRLVNAVVVYTDVYRRTGTGDVFEFRWWFEKASASAVEIYDPRSIVTWLRSLGRRDTSVFLWSIACVAGFPYWDVGHAAVIAAIYLVLLSLQYTVFRNRRRA